MKKNYKLKRPIERKIRFNEKENEYIKKKIEKSPFNNFQNFARTLLIQGEIKNVDFSELKQLNFELSKIGNNINQIAKLANQFEEVSQEDVDYLQEIMSNIQNELSKYYRKNLKF